MEDATLDFLAIHLKTPEQSCIEGDLFHWRGGGKKYHGCFSIFVAFPFPKAVALPFLKELFTWQIWRHDRDTASRLA